MSDSQRATSSEGRCYRCGGTGYLMRVTDKAMQKCDRCQGDGRSMFSVGAESLARQEKADEPA